MANLRFRPDIAGSSSCRGRLWQAAEPLERFFDPYNLWLRELILPLQMRIMEEYGYQDWWKFFPQVSRSFSNPLGPRILCKNY